MSDIVYLSLGSNVGDREKNLREAIGRLSNWGQVISVSSFYETEPVEFTDQAWFLNCAVALETSLKPAELMRELLQIEEAMGRERIHKKGPRVIDLDIVLFGDAVVNTAELVIPHPAMATRRFVLAPLAEIAPELGHPLLNKTVRQLLNDLPPGQKANKL